MYYEKLGHILKHPVPKFRSYPSVRLRDFAEKQVPAKLKSIVNACARTETVTRAGRWCFRRGHVHVPAVLDAVALGGGAVAAHGAARGPHPVPRLRPRAEQQTAAHHAPRRRPRAGRAQTPPPAAALPAGRSSPRFGGCW